MRVLRCGTSLPSGLVQVHMVGCGPGFPRRARSHARWVRLVGQPAGRTCWRVAFIVAFACGIGRLVGCIGASVCVWSAFAGACGGQLVFSLWYHISEFSLPAVLLGRELWLAVLRSGLCSRVASGFLLQEGCV